MAEPMSAERLAEIRRKHSDCLCDAGALLKERDRLAAALSEIDENCHGTLPLTHQIKEIIRKVLNR